MVAVRAAFALGTLVSLAYPRAPFWQVISIYGHLSDPDISLSVTSYSPCKKRVDSFYLGSFGWLDSSDVVVVV